MDRLSAGPASGIVAARSRAPAWRMGARPNGPRRAYGATSPEPPNTPTIRMVEGVRRRLLSNVAAAVSACKPEVTGSIPVRPIAKTVRLAAPFHLERATTESALVRSKPL